MKLELSRNSLAKEIIQFQRNLAAFQVNFESAAQYFLRYRFCSGFAMLPERASCDHVISETLITHVGLPNAIAKCAATMLFDPSGLRERVLAF